MTLFEQRVGFVIEPCRVPEFEGRAGAFGQEGQEALEFAEVLLHPRRKLEEDRAAFAAKTLRRFQEVLDFGGAVLEFLDVRDLLRGLEDKREVLWSVRRPLLEQLRLRHPVEGVVDLHRLETLGVVGEHPFVLELLGIEGPLPLLVGETARTYANPHKPVLSHSRAGRTQ